LLHVMVSLGNPELVAYVLNKGATVDVIDGNGFTPLALASSSYFTESVKVLLNAGADVNLGKGIFPLIQAIYRYATTRSTTVIETLLEHGADPNIRARTGLTATDYAKHWGYEKVVKLIDIHEADLERQRLGAMIQVVARTTNQKMKL
ncbi:MAG TPA: ankyrin repeat domain-containing protein, partial [Anaerovoracaceae bacterium]|nr:ankyrin repeat domain-containing protein [Anaerovoracaceae bacterium]